MFDLPEYGGITLHVDIFHLIIRGFLIFDSTQNGYQFLLKEAAYIWWENTTLNNQLKNAEFAFLF